MEGKLASGWTYEPCPEVNTQTHAVVADVYRLTQGIAHGEETAFAVFYDEYSGQIYRFLLALARGNVDLAEELHQRVMIKAAQKMPTLPDEKQLWRWISHVARNTWRDVLRKQIRESEAVHQLESQSPGKAVSSERINALEQALASLPPSQRALIEWFYFEEEKQKTISCRTGLSVKAVQCELSRIRKKLRGLISKGSHE